MKWHQGTTLLYGYGSTYTLVGLTLAASPPSSFLHVNPPPPLKPQPPPGSYSTLANYFMSQWHMFNTQFIHNKDITTAVFHLWAASRSLAYVIDSLL